MLLAWKGAQRNSVCLEIGQSSNINPQADVVQSLNEESGPMANSSHKNTRIWAVKRIIILCKSDTLFGDAAFQNL